MSGERSDAARQLDSTVSNVGVALSGGGHRAALFGLGVLLYLVRCGRSHDVTHITSVSGGSLTNAFVGQSTDYRRCTAADFEKLAGKLARKIGEDGTLFTFWPIKVYLAAFPALALTAAAALWLACARLAHVGHWRWVAIGLISVGLVAALWKLFSLRGAVSELAFARALFSPGGKPATCSDLHDPLPFHVICATELQSGSGAYFVKLPDQETLPRTGPVTYSATAFCDAFKFTWRPELPLATAVRASAAYPFAFPPVLLPAEAQASIKLRPTDDAWDAGPPQHMVLVDGGIRDNLGVEWFYRLRTLPDLIVVNGASNRSPWKRAGQFVGWVRGALALGNVLYNTRERNQRTTLLRRFLASYAGEPNPDLSGVILHIEDSPYDLAHAVQMRESSAAEMDELFTATDDLEVILALERNTVEWPRAQARAAAVAQALTSHEPLASLRARGGKWARKDDESLVFWTWRERAARHARIPTGLRALGRRPAAELIRHAFVLAMAKLHIVRDYPLVAIPTVEELERLMG